MGATTARDGSRQAVLFIGATVLAWLGFFVHNVADLPGQSLLSPALLVPTLLSVALLSLRLVSATRTLGTGLLLGWATLNLVGGAMSVLPLPLLPFSPEQTVKHYAFHGLYAVTQLPLMWICISWLRAGRRARANMRFVG